MTRAYNHVFGPVPSRRLGRSLGIDLTPLKTCTLDCIFCQLGRTTRKTLTRAATVPVAAVTAEIASWLQAGGKADTLTLAGSGEPTLHTGFGEVLQFVRAHSDIRTALLSNGTLFTLPEVREAARHASIVKLSLSAWDQESFGRVNRPHRDLVFAEMVKGFQRFRDSYQGKLWIEVFLVWGTNSVLHDVERIAAHVNALAADEVHLNTAVRPPAESFAFAMPQKQMARLTGLFRPTATVITEFHSDRSADFAANEETILTMLKRRPCTARQIADVFGMHLNEVSKVVGILSHAGRIRAVRIGTEISFAAAEPQEGE